MSDTKSFVSHDAEGDNVTKDFWIAHFGHATEYNQLDEDRRYNGFGGFVPSLLAGAGRAARSQIRRFESGRRRGRDHLRRLGDRREQRGAAARAEAESVAHGAGREPESLIYCLGCLGR